MRDVRADVGHLQLYIERRAGHWVTGVWNRMSCVWLYRARSTSETNGRNVLLDFASSELGRPVLNQELSWVEIRGGIEDFQLN